MNWKEYQKQRRTQFLVERETPSIQYFTDEEKIRLAEAGASCYYPNEKEGWNTRRWLEGIHRVLHHGCCNGCTAIDICRELSIKYKEG